MNPIDFSPKNRRDPIQVGTTGKYIVTLSQNADGEEFACLMKRSVDGKCWEMVRQAWEKEQAA